MMEDGIDIYRHYTMYDYIYIYIYIIHVRMCVCEAQAAGAVVKEGLAMASDRPHLAHELVLFNNI